MAVGRWSSKISSSVHGACVSEVGCKEISSSVHGALAELIGEVSRRDGGVRDTASTPSSRCATPPMCSANRGRQSCRQRGCSPVGWHRKLEGSSEISSSVHGVCVSEVGSKEISSSVHGALAELIGEVSRRDGGVRDTVSTPSSRCATPPICSANRGRQSWGQIYGINPLVTLCRSPYVLRKQGETILPAGSVVARIGKTLGRGQRPHAICIRRQKQIKYNPYLYNHIIWRRKDAKI